MTSAQWFLLIGALLLVRGLTATLLERSVVTSAIVYLGVGLLVGPSALNLFHFNPLKESALLEALTEVAVLISLFSAGVKMPGTFTFARWRAPVLLATASTATSAPTRARSRTAATTSCKWASRRATTATWTTTTAARRCA